MTLFDAIELFFRVLFWCIKNCFKSKEGLLLHSLEQHRENVILKRKLQRPRLTESDRLLFVLLSKHYDKWRDALSLVKPETVLQWSRRRFKVYWRQKSENGKPGRPKVSQEIRELIRSMSRDNPKWGLPRIRSELGLLGYRVCNSTIAKYRVKHRNPPSQTWKTFIKNHMEITAAIDFFMLPTFTFKILFCFVVLSHDRRKIIHFNVTEYPTAEWTIQQIREAFPYDEAPKYLLRDRDSIYSAEFQEKIKRVCPTFFTKFLPFIRLTN